MQRCPLLPFTFVLFPVATLCAQYGTSSDSALFNRPLEEVVVTASRIQEKLLASPVGVSRMDSRQVRMSASPGFYDALGDLKGVQILTPSLGFRVINTRGFANTTNVRFVQLIDGVDNQAPHIGAPHRQRSGTQRSGHSGYGDSPRYRLGAVRDECHEWIGQHPNPQPF